MGAANDNTDVIGLGDLNFRKPGSRWNLCREGELTGCPPENVDGCLKLDLVYVVSLGTGFVFDYLKGAINSANATIANRTTNYRFGLITVDDLGAVVVEESLSLNNLTSMTTAVNGMADAATGDPGQTSNEPARDINGGLEEAVNTGGSIGTWRTTGDVAKHIILLTGLYPGGDNDTYSATDESELLAAAVLGQGAHNIKTSCIRAHFYTGTYPPAAVRAGVDAILRQVANAGGGTFRAARNVIATSDALEYSILDILDSLCYSDGGSDGNDYDNPTNHLACCHEFHCHLCFVFTCGDEIIKGDADWDGISRYTGDFRTGEAIEAYWALRTETTCTFVVKLEGELAAVFFLCPDPGEESKAIDCRDLGGSFTWTRNADEEYLSCTGTVEFFVREDRRLRRKPGREAGDACLVDVAIVLDTNWRNTPGVEDLQGTVLQPLINHLTTNFDTYQLALIKFSVAASSESIVTPFALNNGTSFLSALNAIVPAGGATLTLDNHREASAAALLSAVNDLAWRDDATKKIIFLNQGRPGDVTPVVDGNAFELAQIAAANAARPKQLTVDTLSIPYVNAGPPISFFYGTGVTSINAQTAVVGGGTHTIVSAVDGAASYNGGTNVLAPAVIARVTGLDCSSIEGECPSHFCGTADCVPDSLCASLNVTEYDGTALCTGFDELDWAATDDCDEGSRSPIWEGTIRCIGLLTDTTYTIKVVLGEDQYGGCTLIAYVTGGGEFAVLPAQSIVPTPDSFTASWVFQLGDNIVSLQLVSNLCGTCGKITVECCANPLPYRFYLTVDPQTPNTLPGSDDCGCAAGTYELVFREASAAIGAFAGWESNILPWPCNQSLVDGMRFSLNCLTGVWTFFAVLYKNGSIVHSVTNTIWDIGICEPFLHSRDGLDLFNSSCLPGLQPNLIDIVITA